MGSIQISLHSFTPELRPRQAITGHRLACHTNHTTTHATQGGPATTAAHTQATQRPQQPARQPNPIRTKGELVAQSTKGETLVPALRSMLYRRKEALKKEQTPAAASGTM